MAKWGEGDPRWIVEQRDDGRNVNNWHWTEKNATNWSKDKIKELLKEVRVENSEMVCEITDVSKCDGEATANNRKAKLIFFYEWTIVADWEGEFKNSDNKTKYKGTIEIPNLSDENDPSDLDIQVNIVDGKQHKLKEFMRHEGVKVIREKCGTYIRLLKEEYSKDLILPTKTAADVTSKPSESSNEGTTNGQSKKSLVDQVKDMMTNQVHSTTKTQIAAVKIPTTKLSMLESFKCRANELYNCFTDINMVRAYTQSSNMTYEATKGGRFSLFDGNITGSFVELVINKKIVMQWRYKQWPDEHYSQATLEFNEKEDCTELNLNQSGVPTTFLDNTREGWRRFYWNAIRQTFGFGSQLM